MVFKIFIYSSFKYMDYIFSLMIILILISYMTTLTAK